MSERYVTCKQCQGKGWYETTLRDLEGRQRDGCGVPAVVPCDQIGCHNGIVDTEAFYRVVGFLPGERP